MKNREEIEDSLNFCKDIKYYEADEKHFLFNSNNYPNLKEYIKWVGDTDKSIAKDYESFEAALNSTAVVTAPVKVPLKVPLKVPVKAPATALASPMEEPVTVTEVPQTIARSIFSFLMELVICVAISVGIVFLVSTFLVTHTKVIGHSMETTLHDGEYLFINRLTYQFSDPKQFDIIVFQHTDDEKYIKRVIACPKQTVQIVDGTIYVDGNVVNENYGNATIMDPGNAKDPITLGDDEYFVLGDNRNNSSDSRFSSVGLIKRDKILGKVLLRFYPFSKFGTVD